MKHLKKTLLILLVFAIAGCSKDEPTDSVPVEESLEPELLSGTFIDSEVSGLKYMTATQQGLTDQNGQFKYYEGEEILFFAGAAFLGSAKAAPVMTPITIASTPHADIDSEEVKNISAFLQTMDADGDASNGISLEPAILASIPADGIQFKAPVIKILGEIAVRVFQETGIELSLVYPEQAAVHLAASLNRSYEPDDPLFLNFIPAFKALRSAHLQGSHLWIHETDDDGNLVKSVVYEKYPFRKLFEYSFFSHNEHGLPIQTRQTRYSPFDRYFTTSSEYTITYTESNLLQSMTFTRLAGLEFTSGYFDEWDDKGRITRINYKNDSGKLIPKKTVVYDEKGIVLKEKLYNTIGELRDESEYTYTETGELDQITTMEGLRQYFYRDDLTLEKWVVVDHKTGSEGTYEYDQTEKAVKYTSILGDETTVSIFWPDLDRQYQVAIRESYKQGTLYKMEIYTKGGTYRILYYDADGNIYRTEYYSTSGDLTGVEES